MSKTEMSPGAMADALVGCLCDSSIAGDSLCKLKRELRSFNMTTCRWPKTEPPPDVPCIECGESLVAARSENLLMCPHGHSRLVSTDRWREYVKADAARLRAQTAEKGEL